MARRSRAPSSPRSDAASASGSPASVCASLSPPGSSSSASSSALSSCPSRSPSPQTSPQLKVDNEQEAWSALQKAETGDVLRSVLTVRRTWKTADGGETVWPVELEAALLEGLERYVPEDTRETRLLGRFPRRNRFISQYILAKTGKHRTPKQVGSRLQQLRESRAGGGEKLLHLLSPFKTAQDAPSSSTPSLSGSPTPSALSFFEPPSSSVPHTTIFIDVLPAPHYDILSHSPSYALPEPTENSFQASLHPRPIASIDSLSAFTSAAPLSAHSRFTVLSESAGLALHAETVPLELISDTTSDVLFAPVYRYGARIVPRYWNVIVQSPDPTRFTIFQEIVKDDSAASVLFTATYRFRYPAVGLPQSPALSLLDLDMSMPLDTHFGSGLDLPLPWSLL
ncbi:TEA domain-containing protein [Mycena indigotica]|uniref:TEA domain-containing protein n=1 Tax=Mycena indigotica TaxID=2126181 RepID=A0A8H6T359_9AGAR|nr:TEA domain-containing protein [Mycena indigotica]KAF7310133.1 TEA domain-containing protein [Mycena indigotica]